MCVELVSIDETLKVVCREVIRGEVVMRKSVERYYHDADEEFVTRAVCGHINYRLQMVSENGRIEEAFIKDLEAAAGYQLMGNSQLRYAIRDKSRGLIAKMVPHNKTQEGTTGGDFGLIIARPEIERHVNCLVIDKERYSGLLCQAKMKRRDGKLGPFTAKQRKILPRQLNYLALVLYSYRDQERRKINPIAWKLCKGSSLKELKNCLKEDKIYHSSRMSQIVTRLGRKEIGTDDQHLIKTVISPDERQSFKIRIYWPDDDNPSDPIRIDTSQSVKEKQLILATL